MITFTQYKTNEKIYKRWLKQYKKDWRKRCQECRFKKSNMCYYCKLEQNENNFRMLTELNLKVKR